MDTQLLAGKIDIASMADLPLLAAASRGQPGDQTRLRMVAVAGYNPRGALSMVVVRTGTRFRSLADLRGTTVSTSLGSTAHGSLVRALTASGLDPETDIQLADQPPAAGATLLQAGEVAGLAQSAVWPGLLVQKNQARAVYDGGALGVPSLSGVVVRQAYAAQHPDVVRAFLAGQLDATRYLWENPLAAARLVADSTGLPPEAVYLYTGRDGIVTFDATLKPMLRQALARDVPSLAAVGTPGTPDLATLVDDSYLRQVYGSRYDEDAASTANRATITGTDPVCRKPIAEPPRAGEIWLAGEERIVPAAGPTCLLRAVAAARRAGNAPKTAYVRDAVTGTRWFAERCVWVRDPAAPADATFTAFTTTGGAQAYAARRPGSRVMSYTDALAAMAVTPAVPRHPSPRRPPAATPAL